MGARFTVPGILAVAVDVVVVVQAILEEMVAAAVAVVEIEALYLRRT
jgi:hypothetical protein